MPSISLARGPFHPGEGASTLGRALTTFFDDINRDYAALLATHGVSDMVTLVGRANGN